VRVLLIVCVEVLLGWILGAGWKGGALSDHLVWSLDSHSHHQSCRLTSHIPIFKHTTHTTHTHKTGRILERLPLLQGCLDAFVARTDALAMHYDVWNGGFVEFTNVRGVALVWVWVSVGVGGCGCVYVSAVQHQNC
jgi:hypothetical protein